MVFELALPFIPGGCRAVAAGWAWRACPAGTLLLPSLRFLGRDGVAAGELGFDLFSTVLHDHAQPVNTHAQRC